VTGRAPVQASGCRLQSAPSSGEAGVTESITTGSGDSFTIRRAASKRMASYRSTVPTSAASGASRTPAAGSWRTQSSSSQVSIRDFARWR